MLKNENLQSGFHKTDVSVKSDSGHRWKIIDSLKSSARKYNSKEFHDCSGHRVSENVNV